MGVCTHKVYTHTQCRHVCICTYTQTEMLSHLKSLKFIRAMGERNAIAEGKAASRPCLYREVYNAEGEGLGDQRGVGVPVHAATAWQSVRGEDELQPPTDALPSVPVTFRPQGWARQASAVSQGLLQHVGWQRYWLHCCPPFSRKSPGQNRTPLLLQCTNWWKNWRAEALTRRESIYPKKPGTTIWNFTELEVHKIEEGRRKTERNHSGEHIMNEKLLKTAVVKALLQENWCSAVGQWCGTSTNKVRIAAGGLACRKKCFICRYTFCGFWVSVTIPVSKLSSKALTVTVYVYLLLWCKDSFQGQDSGEAVRSFTVQSGKQQLNFQLRSHKSLI